MCGEWVDVEPKSHIGGWISRVVRHCEVTLGAIPNLWVGTGKSLSSVNGSRNGMRKKAELFQLFGWYGMWLVLLHYTGKIKKFISCFHCFNRFDNQVIVPSLLDDTPWPPSSSAVGSHDPSLPIWSWTYAQCPDVRLGSKRLSSGCGMSQHSWLIHRQERLHRQRKNVLRTHLFRRLRWRTFLARTRKIAVVMDTLLATKVGTCDHCRLNRR